MREVRLACGVVYTLQQFEDARLSYVPCTYNTPILKFGHFLDTERQVTRASYGKQFNAWKLAGMQGVQLMTGKPSYRVIDGTREYLTDIDIEARLLDRYPEHAQRIIKTYRQACQGEPCIIKTKSDGRRLSAFTPLYGPKVPFTDKVKDGTNDTKTMLLEFFSLMGLSRLDNRYALIEGSILAIPSLPTEALREIRTIIFEVGDVASQSRKSAKVVDASQDYDDLEIVYDADGKSQIFSNVYCRAGIRQHDSGRATVQFFKNADGSEIGHCVGCDGSWIRKKAERKTKLAQVDSQTPPETETLQENAEQRETAITDTLNAALGKTHKTHITLVTDVTGSGKSHTTLAKAKSMGKRPIALLPHKALADQAVALANDVGFRFPFHLKGRGQNWHDSEIADIPIEDRTDALFEKNLCIMVDELEKHTEKRLPAGEYCFKCCPFHDNCEYWKQYEKVRTSDALMVCTPNLLFDPELLGFLRRLTKGTDTTAEDDAITAALGTPLQNTDDFDMAVIDDYSVASLYNEQYVTLTELKRLVQNWEGYALCSFAEKLAQVFFKDSPAEIYKHIETILTELDTPTRDKLRKQMIKHPRWGTLETAEVPLASKETKYLLSEWDIIFEDGGRAKVAINDDAFLELRRKQIPAVQCQVDWKVGDRVMIPYTPFEALKAGITLSDISPVWQRRWTLLHQLQHFIRGVQTAENAPIKIEGETLHFTTPPRASSLIPKIFLLSATADPKAVRNAFGKQRGIKWTKLSGKPIEWAKGVEVYQYADHRITSASTFEYQTDTDGKRKLQTAPMALTTTAEKRFEKLNNYAKNINGTSLFISYKDIAETQAFKDRLNAFDIVTHFDRIAGLNIKDLGLLVIYGYPKVRHQDVLDTARIQFAHSNAPLPEGSYEELTQTQTFTENGLIITERRYEDKRLEEIRHQLVTDKLIQAVGRARLPRWENIITIVFTNAPIPSITDRAMLFSGKAFNAANTPQDLPKITAEMAAAEADGDVQTVTELENVSERTAYRRTQDARKAKKQSEIDKVMALHAEGKSKRSIANLTGFSLGKVQGILRKNGCIKIDKAN